MRFSTSRLTHRIVSSTFVPWRTYSAQFLFDLYDQFDPRVNVFSVSQRSRCLSRRLHVYVRTGIRLAISDRTDFQRSRVVCFSRTS